MITIPAIDMSQSSCVRLVHGRMKNKTVYSENPVKMAEYWEQQGAIRLHLVDLDGALSGEIQHWDILEKIRQRLLITLELGGGFRTETSVRRALDMGIDKVILGTLALSQPNWLKDMIQSYPNRLIAGLDFSQNSVATHGWLQDSGLSISKAIESVELFGFKELIFTDISKDGTLKGVDIKLIQDLFSKIHSIGYYSGGITSIEDIVNLKKISNVAGIILGKSLYDKRISFSDVLSHQTQENQ